MFGIDCNAPAVKTVSDSECCRQAVVQSSLEALAHQKLARENLEAVSIGSKGCCDPCSAIGKMRGKCRSHSKKLRSHAIDSTKAWFFILVDLTCSGSAGLVNKTCLTPECILQQFQCSTYSCLHLFLCLFLDEFVARQSVPIHANPSSTSAHLAAHVRQKSC